MTNECIEQVFVLFLGVGWSCFHALHAIIVMFAAPRVSSFYSCERRMGYYGGSDMIADNMPINTIRNLLLPLLCLAA